MPRRQGTKPRDTKALRRRRRTAAARAEQRDIAKRAARADQAANTRRLADLLIHTDKESRPRY